jgi:UDP-N-acetylmuramoylalanine--D-glutamate ligase
MMSQADPSQLKDKRVLVVGLGKTGISLCHFLCESGAKVTVTDHKSKAEILNQLELVAGLPLTFELGGHNPKVFLQQDLIILSPGIPGHLKIFDYARAQGIKITGEMEFVSRFIQEPILAITGTNGKTTVAALIQSMLKESGVETWVGGLFGEPLTQYLRQKNKAKVVICEVSSHMLETVEDFNPAHIVFTNLAESHLDRYKSMEDYVNAKRKIFKNVNLGTLSILNADDNAVIELARDPVVQRGRIAYFSRRQILEPQIMTIGGAVAHAHQIVVRMGPEKEYYSTKQVKLRGSHSLENLMAAILAAKEYGATGPAIQKTIDEFRGLPHRIEYVRKVGGVFFFNDSKATNVHATIRGIDAFDDNVILIAGGKDANLSFEPLRGLIKKKVKSLILYGEAKERINRDIGDFSETFLIGTFEEAILIAYQKSRIGDVVLLSPGCPSLDLFDSYEERGNYFKEIVKKFK